MDRNTPDQYHDVYNAFSWDLPATFNYGRDVIDEWARKTPDHKALIWCDESGATETFTFADISRLTSQFANLLIAQGVKKGDRVIVMLPRLPQWQIAMVGCIKAGAVPIPCIEMLTEKDIGYRLDNSQAIAVVTTAPNIGKYPEGTSIRIRISVGSSPGWIDMSDAIRKMPSTFECDDTALDDPAIIYYTSGSTGMPKGVTHAARALFAWRVCGLFWHELTQQDLMWCTADTGWSKAGTSILWSPWSCGSTVFFYHGRFDAAQRLELIRRFGVTVFCGAATEFRHIINLDFSRQDLPSLRMAVSAGESVNPEVLKRWHEKSGVPLIEAYGQTETLMTVSNYMGSVVKPGSMGRPLPGSSVAILDETGKPLPAGERGQLAVVMPNPQAMIGYWNDPARTATTRVHHNGVEYFLTGDMASMDDDGYVFYAGRSDDIISSAGYRIGPMEVENALLEHPAVLESAVVGSPDPERGEVVKAFVLLRPGVNPSDDLVREIQEHVKRTTAPYKYPRLVEFVHELPKTVTGKLLRRQLRDEEYQRRANMAPS